MERPFCELLPFCRMAQLQSGMAPEDHHAIEVGAKTDAAAAIGKTPQTFKNVVAGRPGKTDFGDPCNLGREV